MVFRCISSIILLILRPATRPLRDILSCQPRSMIHEIDIVFTHHSYLISMHQIGINRPIFPLRGYSIPAVCRKGLWRVDFGYIAQYSVPQFPGL